MEGIASITLLILYIVMKDVVVPLIKKVRNKNPGMFNARQEITMQALAGMKVDIELLKVAVQRLEIDVSVLKSQGGPR